jgi:hypothetical protein
MGQELCDNCVIKTQWTPADNDGQREWLHRWGDSDQGSTSGRVRAKIVRESCSPLMCRGARLEERVNCRVERGPVALECRRRVGRQGQLLREVGYSTPLPWATWRCAPVTPVRMGGGPSSTGYGHNA